MATSQNKNKMINTKPEIRRRSGFKIKLEELPACIRASARKGLLGSYLAFEEVPFEITYWKEQRHDDMPWGYSDLHYDTEIDVRKRTYFYNRNRFSGISAITGASMGGKSFRSIKHLPIQEDTLQQYSPIIQVLEEKVGRRLIERPLVKGEIK